VFLLGAEHSDGTGALVDSMARSEPGVIVRRMNATVIPPLSDYEPFWRRNVPFAFLSNGRSQRYHTPDDRPEYLAYAKMESTARWLTRFVREQCSRTEPTLTFRPEARDDASTLRTAREITHALGALDPRAAALAARCDQLLAQTDGEGRLPESLRDEPVRLVQRLESALA
jgi:hypothetical protein